MFRDQDQRTAAARKLATISRTIEIWDSAAGTLKVVESCTDSTLYGVALAVLDPAADGPTLGEILRTPDPEILANLAGLLIALAEDTENERDPTSATEEEATVDKWIRRVPWILRGGPDPFRRGRFADGWTCLS